jgi:Putative peptidoglycan binding domain/Penicillin-insensitive murein endopeptidase
MPDDVDEIPEYLRDGEDMVPENLPGMPTAAAAVVAAAGVVTSKLTLPTDGLYGYASEARRFGIAEAIAALLEVGRVWNARHPDSPIGVGDISKVNGGEISGHASHQKGIDADIRPMRNDGQEAPVVFTQTAYSRVLTQELVDLFHANGKLAAQIVFFNDPNVVGVNDEPNHDNHLHVRFHFPGVVPAPPLLVLDHNNPAVGELQRRLNLWIAASGSTLPPLVVDRDFGQNTLAAVKALQTAKGLTADGKVGRDTWAALPIA